MEEEKKGTTDCCNVEVEEAEEGRRKDRKQGSFRLSKVDGGENVRSVAGMCLAGCRLPVTSLAANTAQRYVCSIGNFFHPSLLQRGVDKNSIVTRGYRDPRGQMAERLLEE